MAKGMTWDAAADRKLFLGILKASNITVDYKAMAEYMSTTDQVCTAEALKGRLKKLKAMAKEDTEASGLASDDNTEKAAKGTPRKRAAGAADGESPSKKKATKGKKAKAEADEEETGTTEQVKKEEEADESA